MKLVKMGTILTNFTLVGLTNLSFQCRATPAASVSNIVTEDDPGLKDDGVDETTGVDSDLFHRQYDSPIKEKPVQHIQEQDAEIEHLNKCLTWSNSPLLKLRCKHDAYQT